MAAAAPTMCSAYRPHPGRGESPTLPGDLKGAPEVETPTVMFPMLSNAISPVEKGKKWLDLILNM